MADPSRPTLASLLGAAFRQVKVAPRALVPRRGPLRPILLVAVAALLMDQLADIIQRNLIYFPTRLNLENLLARCSAVVRPYNYEADLLRYQIKPLISVLNLRQPFSQKALLLTPAPGTGTTSIKRLWVVTGGNAMTSLDWVPFIEDVLKETGAKDLAFLLVDYPGYLSNEGPTSSGLALKSAQEALNVAFESLRDRGISVEALGFMGHSLGCANMLQLAASLSREQPERMTKENPARLVLSAPFTSIPNMGQALFGSGVGIRAAISMLALTSRHVWNNEKNLASLVARGPDHCSIHILHGTHDEIVPVFMGRKLHEQCKASGLKLCSFTERSRAMHNDILGEAFPEFVRLISSNEDQLEARL